MLAMLCLSLVFLCLETWCLGLCLETWCLVNITAYWWFCCYFRL